MLNRGFSITVVRRFGMALVGVQFSQDPTEGENSGSNPLGSDASLVCSLAAERPAFWFLSSFG
jgi:hypothetical protein